MKLVLAAFAFALAAAAATPSHAESSYWEQRWRTREATPEYGHRHRAARDHVDVRIVKRRRGGYGEAEAFRRRSYNGPVYQSQEQVQQSVRDFATGGPGDVDSYR